MLPAGGGTYQATVHRVSGNCGWTATADTTAEIIGPVAGNGDGTFVFRVLPADTTFRFGSVNLVWDGGSAPFGYVQVACRVVLAASTTFDAAGGTKTVGELLWAACPTIATADTSWIAVVMPASGGIQVVVVAAPNPSGATRSGTVTVKTVFGDVQTVPITQTAN